jgi:hypothetical protein
MADLKMSAAEFKQSGIIRGKGGKYTLPTPDISSGNNKLKAERTNKYNNHTGYWTDWKSRVFYMKSQMEANYAYLLDFLVKLGHLQSWEYEPTRFDFSSDPKSPIRSYVPDFRLTFANGEVEYHETKGLNTVTSKRKFKLMAKYYPGVLLKLVTYEKLNHLISKFGTPPGWDTPLLKVRPILNKAVNQ